jgi:hypothetical protein
MRVVTVADMTKKASTNIMDSIKCGEWRTGTDLKWPKNYYPRKS